MPDPILYTQAMTVAALASAIFVLALGRALGRSHANLVCVISIAAGLVVGYRVLHLRVAWPPVGALDRLLTLIIPTVIGIEGLAGLNRLPRWLPWFYRLGLAALTPRILLHGSVYLSDTATWPAWRSGVLLTVSSVMLVLMWWLTLAVARKPVTDGSHRSDIWGPPSAVSVSLSLCLSIQCAAATIMLAGYVTGGAAALPLTAALVGAVLGSRLLTQNAEATGIIGIGVVGLFGLLFIGRFFGGLSTAQALTILLAPLLCWVTETTFVAPPSGGGRSLKAGLRTYALQSWQIGAIRLVLVAIPLIAVVVLEMQDFNRHTMPLLK